MSILKCKMCGGTIEFNPGETVCTCEYCNTKQTLPKLDDDRKANLYDRANHFRRNNEYDKAMSIYEQILNEDSTDAESYWSLVLCKYGIEYVEDPATHRRVPTVNRAQFTSVVADEDYKKALEYASIEQKIIYEDEARAIDEIQKGILEISSKEEPFDVFICYKETDNNGRRTPDSVLANDLYHQLTQEGFKVFFSRITLEDKLGTAYEPYIFAALNSAKVMVVLGTKQEYFNAVWVKNEWSRYLALIRKGEKKMLIPAYKDMDPYDLPEEFSHLQAQDMTKLGFMQDLIRGIKKIVGANQVQPVTTTQVVNVGGYNANITALLKRGNMAIEDGDWAKADGFFEEVLNQDPECADAYLGKYLVSQQTKSLSDHKSRIEQSTEYAEPKKLMVLTDDEHINSIVKSYTIPDYLSSDEIRKMYNYDTSFESTLQSREKQKTDVLSNLHNDKLYNRIKQYATDQLADDLASFESNLISLFDQRIADAKSSDESSVERINNEYAQFIEKTDFAAEKKYKAAMAQKDHNYNLAVKNARNSTNSQECNSSIQYLKDNFSGYEDCDSVIAEIRRKRDSFLEAEETAAKDKARKARRKRRCVIVLSLLVVVVVITAIIMISVIIPNSKYDHAVKLMNDGKYAEAISEFEKLDGYKQSDFYITHCQYYIAIDLMANDQYEEAMAMFEELDGYLSSEEYIGACRVKVIQNGNYSVGDTVIFGDYHGHNQWIILEVEDSALLLLSDECVSKREYDDYFSDWSSSSLHGWLNGTYYDSAFTSYEKDAINGEVSLLNEGQAKRLLSEEQRVAFYDGEACAWWLRDMVSNNYGGDAPFVTSDGYVSNGWGVSGTHGVRPAIWINLVA